MDATALARKYRALMALRAARDGSAEATTTREQLQALAAEFPGCLRELDTLGATELARRATAVEEVATGGPVERWMEWIAAYHRLMRATLAIKQQLGENQSAAVSQENAAKLAHAATAAAGLPVDAAYVHAVAAPPQGRLGIVVLRALGTFFGTTATEIAATLFPPRRPRPYEL